LDVLEFGLFLMIRSSDRGWSQPAVVEIRLLGPLEAFDDAGSAVTLAGPKLRALLAVLASRPGQVCRPSGW
jgi:hypothetical protein